MNHKLTEAHVAYLLTLEQQGRQTAEAILDDAKRAESPLHDLYDWDIQTAAEAHWLDRTRAIIRLVKVVVHTETHTYRIPRYVKDPSRPNSEQGYASIDHLRIETALARRALVTELERVTSALRRARNIALGLALEDEVDRLLTIVAGLRVVVSTPTVEPETAPSENAASPAA
jgi:hypothetical protein